MTVRTDSHGHGHGHPAGDAPEVLPGPSPVASVVLDIGEGVGAAVVRTPASLAGAEIEIRPAGEPWCGVHTAVRERQVPPGSQFAAVFGSLPEGRYELRVRGSEDERPVMGLDVAGASVADVGWPAAGECRVGAHAAPAH